MGNPLSALGGIFGPLFAPIGTVFHFVFFEPVFNILILIYHGTSSLALAIIILTLLIRGALFPLTRRQLSSSRKMQELAPKLKQIQAQHRGDPQAAMAAQQALYKEHGVSMYGGCLPLLIQMPFLYALFYSFETLLGGNLHTINSYIYPFLPPLLHLPATTFLWTDLAHADKFFILPVIAGILTFIQMRMALPVTKPGGASDPTQQTAKSMQWVMPLFTIFLGSRFPSGLALYWTVSTGFSAVQQYFISGWGSLFVGVPGMERFVPAPKDTTTTTVTARGGSAVNGRSAPGQTTPEPPAQRMGFRELISQMRSQARNQAAAATDQRLGKGSDRVVDSTPPSGAAKNTTASSVTRQVEQQQRSARDTRRPKPARSGGATLIKPAPAASPSGNGAAGSKAALPENRLAQDATDSGLSGASGPQEVVSAASGPRAAVQQSQGSNAGKTGASSQTAEQRRISAARNGATNTNKRKGSR